MHTGAITGYIDVAQLALYAFWIIFAGLILYLRREDKREGYPLISDSLTGLKVQGFPPLPAPKFFKLPHGEIVSAPRFEAPEVVHATPTAGWPGAPLHPTGNPMIDGVGPASYALRSDHPDLTWDGALPKIVPLRADPIYLLAGEDPDPRGMPVLGADRLVGGVVRDVWVDRSEAIARYIEVTVDLPTGPRHVLVPMTMVRIDDKLRVVRVASILAAQFATAPVTKDPDLVTLREEDRTCGYFAGGYMYATPTRIGPLL
jgi:photosynthetic reaction center H subunit